MSSMYSWQNFMTYHGGIVGARDCFERVMEETIQKLYPNEQVELVQASRGDGGIDVYKGQIGIESITVFQCKFFTGKLEYSQWKQIKESFLTAVKSKDFKMKKWVLCLPKTLTLEENIEWTNWNTSASKDYKVEIELWSGDRIINNMEDVGIVKKYFRQTISKYVTNTPPSPAAEFKYRDADMKSLLIDIQKNNILISGLGGIGKSTIAKAIYHHIKNDYEYIGWINYNGNLKQDIMLNFLIFQDIQDINMREREIENFIIQAEERMVLFIDNVDSRINSDSFLQILDGSVKLILTSRINYIKNFKTYYLNSISEDDAVNLFRVYYQRDLAMAEKDVRELVDSIKQHTLMIELVAKAALWAEDSLKGFIAKLKISGFGYSEAELISEHNSKEVTIAEHLSKLFAIQLLTKEQKRILKNFAITSDITLPYDFRDWISADKKQIMNLISLGWIYKDDNGYSMHPIVKQSIRLQENINFGECKELVNKIVSAGFYDVNIGYNKLAIRQEIAENIVSVFPPERYEVTQTVMGILALSYSKGRRNKKAFEYLKRDLQLNLVRHREYNKYTARTYFDLLCICVDTYKDKEALIYAKRAEQLCRNVFGEESFYMFEIYKSYGIIYTMKKDFSVAEQYYKKCLNGKYSEISNSDKLSVRFNLGSLAIEQQDYKNAKDILEDILPVCEMSWSSRKDNMAVLYSNLAIVYASEENYEVSEKYDKMALEIRIEIYGEEHQDTAISYLNLAHGYFHMHAYKDAALCLNQAKLICDKVIDEKSELTTKINYLEREISEKKKTEYDFFINEKSY